MKSATWSFDYKNALGIWRPLLDIKVGPMEFQTVGLVDSGAVNSIFDDRFAYAAGIDLTGAEERTLGFGGGTCKAKFVVTQLSVREFYWEAEVGFAESPPCGWALLGESLFRYFKVAFSAADREFFLTPNSE